MSYGNYPSLSGVKKILVIKFRQLGDVLLTAPVFHVLKKRFPDAEIHGYIYQESIPLLEGHLGVDRLIGYDRSWKRQGFFSKIFKEFSLLSFLKKQKYDLVINLTEGDRGAIAAKASKAKIRVGFSPKGRMQKKVYTHVVKHCESPRHTVERNLDALRRIGIFPDLEERELFFKTEPYLEVSGPFVLIHPSSRWRFKCLPSSLVREVTEKLLAKGIKVVFSGGPDLIEKEMISEITEGLNVVNLCGKLSLKQLGGLISSAACLFCVDSVPFHMASALKSNVVAVFGPTSELTWGPWRNPNARVLFEPLSCRPCHLDGCGGSKVSDCLTRIPSSKILESILSFL